MNKTKKKDLDEILQDALENAPSIDGYTIRQLRNVINSPWTRSRWHLERLDARGIVEPYDIGKHRIYRRTVKNKRTL